MITNILYSTIEGTERKKFLQDTKKLREAFTTLTYLHMLILY
jgi:hypothetical protein